MASLLLVGDGVLDVLRPQGNRPQPSHRQNKRQTKQGNNNHKDTAKQNHLTALPYNKRISSNNLFFLSPSATRNPA
jgi:hypothetical protein